MLTFIYFKSFVMRKGDRRYVIGNMALIGILLGAISNFLDRIIYGRTVDYLLIFTGVINIADVMIALGFVVYWMNKSEARSQKSETNPNDQNSNLNLI